MNTQLEALQNPEAEVQRITNILFTLPLEKIIEVRDFSLFLQAHYGQIQVTIPATREIGIDIDDAWSDEDQHDLSMAALRYAQQITGTTDEYVSETR